MNVKGTLSGRNSAMLTASFLSGSSLWVFNCEKDLVSVTAENKFDLKG